MPRSDQNYYESSLFMIDLMVIWSVVVEISCFGPTLPFLHKPAVNLRESPWWTDDHMIKWTVFLNMLSKNRYSGYVS